MNITEARRVVTNMAAQYKALTTLSDALAILENGDNIIEGLTKRKGAAEAEMIIAQDRLKTIQTEISDKIDELNKKHKEQIALLNTEINDKSNKLAGLNKELADMRTTMQTETKRLITERSVELKKIDELVADRVNKLDKMNQEIEKVRTKIMG